MTQTSSTWILFYITILCMHVKNRFARPDLWKSSQEYAVSGKKIDPGKIQIALKKQKILFFNKKKIVGHTS